MSRNVPERDKEAVNYRERIRLVVLARSLNPIPSRTRPLNSSAPMVLWLKPWESRSLPGLPRTRQIPLSRVTDLKKRRFLMGSGAFFAQLAHRLDHRSCRAIPVQGRFISK